MLAPAAGHWLAGIDAGGEICSCGSRGSVLEHLAELITSRLTPSRKAR